MALKCGSNSPVADVAVVWARNEEGKIKGVLVEKGMKALQHRRYNKMSLKVITGELVFDNVKIKKRIF